MKNAIFLLLSATLAAMILTGCGPDSECYILDADTRASIVDQVSSELAYSSFDSIGSTVIVVHPEISSGPDNNDGMNLLRIVAVIAPFAFVIAIVWLVLGYKRSNLLSQYRVIENAIRNGVRLPESFYVGRYTTPSIEYHRRLYRALLWIAVGASMILFALAVSERELVAICTLPLFIGIAKLLACLLNRNSDRNSEEQGL